jgi:coproporphyrinogen III oxidase
MKHSTFWVEGGLRKNPPHPSLVKLFRNHNMLSYFWLSSLILWGFPSGAVSWSGIGLPPNRKHRVGGSRILTNLAQVADSSSAAAASVSGATDLAAQRAQHKNPNVGEIFDDFVRFLETTQAEIIATVEEMDGSGAKFTLDSWGLYNEEDRGTNAASGGKTRVLQGGGIVEKGACSLTLIRRGVLSSERAAAIRSRQDATAATIKAGDVYSAAALSIVFHSRSPLIPTFRSDVRIFLVQSSDEGQDGMLAFLGGGADLTPYYLFDDDVSFFHGVYRDLCRPHEREHPDLFSYSTLKRQCDDYFYLPARSEHRGTGGIFFDDVPAATPGAIDFCQQVALAWMPSWLPIVEKRRALEFTDQQRRWQLLRRGRYLEFNLLYDRGVKFGLANANPRVEGVMVSAPPLIAFEYNHAVEEGSEEARLMDVLKKPIDWA